jgi:O-methyltransferase
MSVRDLAKRVVLLAPPVRTLYEAMLAEGLRARALESEYAQAKELARFAHAEELAQSAAHAEALRIQLQGDRDRLQGHCDRLQSDYERSAAHAEDLRTRLQDAELRSERVAWLAGQAERRAETETLRRAELEAKIANPPASAMDLQYANARLLGHLSILSAELTGLRRIINSAQSEEGGQVNGRLRIMYLDLLEAAVSGSLYDDPSITPGAVGTFDPQLRMIGFDWPSRAPTMIGTARLRNIRTLTERILEDAIEGDFLEAGVWRGGACIYMRGLFAAYGISDRKVFAADSFAGLPPPESELYPADAGDQHHLQPELAASLDEVKANFARFGLLDEQVIFLPGWFKDTLPTAPVERLALLRLDGDMYGSTMETLTALYSKVSPGGYIIIDDYILGPCRQAVEDFRRDHGCSESLQDIDGAGVFWQKQASS